jgi:hypothetical protein
MAKNMNLSSTMFGFPKKISTSLLVSSIIMGTVTPVFAQYSCPSREIQRVHEVGDYKFELKGCQRSGKKVICSAWITQTNKDIKVNYLNGTGHTRLVDAAGTEYISSSIQAGSQIQNRDNYPISISLVKHIPIQVSATFLDVPTLVQDVALFELALDRYDENSAFQRDFKGQLRNTKITELTGGNPPVIKKKK